MTILCGAQACHAHLLVGGRSPALDAGRGGGGHR